MASHHRSVRQRRLESAVDIAAPFVLSLRFYQRCNGVAVATPMTSEAVLVVLVSVFLVIVCFARLVGSIHTEPDPWDADIDLAVRQPDAVLVCHRCITPQLPGSWFCPECGAAVGPYNNCLPWIRIFSIGEVYRAGAWRNLPVTLVTVVGLLLVSALDYTVFVPFFWYRLWRNLSRIRRETLKAPMSQ